MDYMSFAAYKSMSQRMKMYEMQNLHRSSDSYDAIVIGAGHNGLVTANYLARKGMSVLVLEKRDVVGGACTTERPWPDYPEVKSSTASYVCSMLDPKIISELNLAKYGFKFLKKDPQSFTPLLDGGHLFLYSDPEATKREIAKFSKKDAETYEEYNKFIANIGATLESTLKQSPPDMNVSSLLRYGIKNRKVFKNALPMAGDVASMFSMSVQDLLDRWFESETLKASLATDGFVGTKAAPSTPGTAYVLLHHVIGGTAGGSWGYIEGGMGTISFALQNSLEEYGELNGVRVKVLTNSPVDHIIVENGAVRGVATIDGKEFKSRIVVSNADPKVTFLSLVNQKELPEEFLRKVLDFRTSSSSYKLNLLLNGLPNFTVYPNRGNSPGPQHGGSVYMGSDTYEMMERAFDEVKYGRASSEPIVSLTIPSAVDRTLAPEGMYVAGCFVHHAPLELRGTTWEEEKSRFEDRIIGRIEQYAPNIRDIIVATHGLSPLDLQNEFSLTGGNIFHGELSLDQVFSFRFGYTTPINGLYMCGSGTHPGGGVSGLPGLNAAKEILRR